MFGPEVDPSRVSALQPRASDSVFNIPVVSSRKSTLTHLHLGPQVRSSANHL